MFKGRILAVLVLIACFSTAYAEDNFKIDITPELQERVAFGESRVQAPASNFGYRTVRLTVKAKQPGDRPVIWAKFYAADGTLLETIWDRIKSDHQQKCKFDYMDVNSTATRIEVSIGKQN